MVIENDSSSPFTVSKGLQSVVKLGILRFLLRLRRRPYNTIFYLTVILTAFFPAALLTTMVLSVSSIYFFVYLLLFLSTGSLSLLLIVPLFAMSLIFAGGVITSGFLSNITFKLGQSIYYKTDRRMRFLVTKMTDVSARSEENIPPTSALT